MRIDQEDLQKARSGDSYAMVNILEAHLSHIQAVADLITTASGSDAALKNDTLRDSAWLIEEKAGESLSILNEWHENSREKKEAQA